MAMNNKRNERNLDMLARMSDDWDRTTDDMIQVAIGLLLWQLDVDAVTIRVDDIPIFLEEHDVVRTYEDIDGVATVTFRKIKKEKSNETEVPTGTA